jgi:hypothetical protein
VGLVVEPAHLVAVALMKNEEHNHG